MITTCKRLTLGISLLAAGLIAGCGGGGGSTDARTATLDTPTITWATPTAIAPGTALTATQLNASSNVPGSFNYSPAMGTVMSTAGVYTLTATFIPTDYNKYTTQTAAVTLSVLTGGTAVVDFGSAGQTIRGFGVSEAWAGSVMPNTEVTSLYGTSGANLGLSIMRVRIAPTTWNLSTKAADTSAWTVELTNAKAAQAMGATIFASSWTPPASMKTNGSINEGSLSTSSYSDYANYLKAYVNYATNQGVNLYAVSMQNEPDWNPCKQNGVDEGPTGADCYESCLWTAAQMDVWVAGYGSVLTQGINPVKLIMPESFYFSQSMSDTALNDSTAAANIAIIGGHLYGAKPSYYANAVNKGKDVWMTEHFINSVSAGPTTSIADAIAAAEEIHDSMTVGQYNAYVWWWATGSSSSVQTHLLDSTYAPTYFGYALAQYARFIRPGYVRYAATPTPSSGVYMSAYAGSGHYVIVAINSNTSAVAFPIQINSQMVTLLTPYQTTSTSSIAQQSTLPISNNTFTAILPAQSITTFVQ
ncbi:MAG: hypothetical protein P4L10_01015 [Acidobacteriaceae bacterium]|nr:hypothetical protein [Acidobacteriaceae bacterium]